LLFLGIASGAQASLGVTGSTGGQGSGQGLLSQPRGVAVNGTGNGGVPAGTGYVAEQGNGRITRFGPSGTFVSSFGRGIVSSGENLPRPRQRIDVDATAGNYRLRGESARGTGHIDGTNQVTGLSVSYGAFHVGDEIQATGIPAGTTVTAVGAGTLQLSASATSTGDPFIQAFETTSDIEATASASELESALEALPFVVGFGGLNVEGGPGGPGAETPYLVAWNPPNTFARELTVVPGSIPLSGGAATAQVAAMDSFGAFAICKANPPSNDVCKFGFGSDRGVAVNQATGDVYVRNERGLEQFSADGEFIRGFGGGTIISGPGDVTPTNARQEIDVPAAVTDGTFTLEFGGEVTPPIPHNATAATVQSELEGLPSIGGGNIAVSGGDGAAAPFIATFTGVLGNNPEPAIAIDSTNLVGGSGSVTVLEDGASEFEICGPINNCRPGFAGSAGGFVAEGQGGYLAIVPPGAPNAGNVIAADPGNRRVQEFSANGGFIRAFGFDVVAAGPSNIGTGFEECKFGDACKAGLAGSAAGQFANSQPSGVAVDSTGAIYTVESSGNFRVQKFTPQPGPVTLSPEVFGSAGAPNGVGSDTSPRHVAIGSSDNVLVLKRVTAGATASCPDGEPSVAEDRIQELSPTGSLLDTHMVCNGFNEVSGIAYDSSDGTVLTSVIPQTFPVNQVFEIGPVEPPTATLESLAEISSTAVKLIGKVNPNTGTSYSNPTSTSYQVEYKLSSDSTWTPYLDPTPVGAGTSDISVGAYLSGLIPNSSYDVRLVAKKQYREGVTHSAPQTFSTLPSAPEISAFSSTDVTETTANLHATINPFGEATKYRFEYGTTPSYGSSAPIPDGDLAAVQGREHVTVHITGLDGGTYHFRVVAENGSGSTATGDQTFNFFPPTCPNAHLRQQTGASYLPDCRAYELVSPSNAGNTSLEAGGPYAPQATSPSRFAFGGFFGTIDGTGEPVGVGRDLYVATRTSSGWVTRYVGIPGTQTARVGGPPAEGFSPPLEGIRANLDLSEVIDWDRGQTFFVCCGLRGSFAPYLWTAEGSPLGRLPTNLSEVPQSELDISEGGYVGGVGISPDFSNYVFSASIPFAPGGLEAVPGSAYDNDVEAGTVTLISKTESGEDIPAGVGSSHPYIEFPAVSTDGSHILMSTEGAGGNLHLYMAVDGIHHYDVSVDTDGLVHAVDYIGMTADGSKVLFASTAQLSADDTDDSSDIFMWTEANPGEVTRISTGSGGAGNSDACVAAWTTGCGALPIKTGVRSDNSVASIDGTTYFYSPEQLDGGNGTPGQRNLYRFSDGQVRFVATLFGSATVNRIQLSPNADHLALVTSATLTPQSTGGHLAMYAIDPATDAIKCVSCNPNGTEPSYDVAASQNGLFMSDDGRTFFSTRDSLVSQDTNGLIDSYEFVDNRPQLLTSGTGDQDSGTGFVAVSANGVDAYLATKESFVGQDTVGPFLKFYNARVGGGIPFAVEPAPCAAADECHGPSNAPPSKIAASTGAALGDGGNHKSGVKTKKKKKKSKQNRKKKKKKSRRHRRHDGNRGGHRG
jgi:hypothetical protein